jgi:hypothetical protein
MFRRLDADLRVDNENADDETIFQRIGQTPHVELHSGIPSATQMLGSIH